MLEDDRDDISCESFSQFDSLALQYHLPCESFSQSAQAGEAWIHVASPTAAFDCRAWEWPPPPLACYAAAEAPPPPAEEVGAAPPVRLDGSSDAAAAGEGAPAGLAAPASVAAAAAGKYDEECAWDSDDSYYSEESSEVEEEEPEAPPPRPRLSTLRKLLDVNFATFAWAHLSVQVRVCHRSESGKRQRAHGALRTVHSRPRLPSASMQQRRLTHNSVCLLLPSCPSPPRCCLPSARVNVQTRSFILPSAQQGVSPSFLQGQGNGSTDGIALMPIIGLVNHATEAGDRRPNAKVVWRTLRGVSYFCIEATHAIPAGEEVLISYGARSGGDLLIKYARRMYRDILYESYSRFDCPPSYIIII